MELKKNKPVPLLTARDKMDFEVTPILNKPCPLLSAIRESFRSRRFLV